MRPDFSVDLAVEAMIRDTQIEHIVILGHINPDGDAIGSVMGLAHYLHFCFPGIHFYPHISIHMSNGPELILKDEKIFDPLDPPPGALADLDEPYGVIVCDTATKDRIYGREYYQKAVCNLVLDHHLGNEGYGQVRFVSPLESCSEMITLCIDPEKLKASVKAERQRFAGREVSTAADYLYMGILHDTDTFNRADERTLAAAQILLGCGVDHRRIQCSRNNMTMYDIVKRAELLKKTERFYKDQIALLYVDLAAQEQEEILYEEIHPLSSTMRDCKDVLVGITMFEMAPGDWKMSFRSDGKCADMNAFATPFGGGGHRGASSLRTRCDDPETLKIRLVEALTEILREAGF